MSLCPPGTCVSAVHRPAPPLACGTPAKEKDNLDSVPGSKFVILIAYKGQEGTIFDRYILTFFFILSEDWNDAKAAAAEYAAEPEVPGVGVDPCGVYTSSGD